MALKRQARDGGDGDSDLLNKRRHLLSTIFKGTSKVRNFEEGVSTLEPIIRKWVNEEVNRAVDSYLSRTLDAQTESSKSRNLRLQLDNNLPSTLFTSNRIISEASTPVKIALYDASRQEIVTSGPYSSMKVEIVVVQGDFAYDCRDEWCKKEFDSKVVQSREGKRPLLNGDKIVSLKNGVGYVGGCLFFTDNSSWIRSGKFRLGVKVHSGRIEDETSVREGISNAFKVKDHRGESYQKLHPPSLNDEVWRLEKIAKDGAYHKQLSKLGISNVGDFLRLYATNQIFLRAALRNISNKKWEIIAAHAATCILDDKKFIYRTAQGTVLLFNSIYKVIGVAFDGHTYQSVDALDTYQMRIVEDLKQRAYANLDNWESCEADSNIIPQHITQGEVEMQMNKGETEHHNSAFALGESSRMQGFNLTFTNSFGLTDDPLAGLCMEPQLSPRDFAVDDDFEVESSALKGNEWIVSFFFQCIMKLV
ncbi:hypothetical protein C2S52_004658 [Perilla frutescens var. hirtella]|nr:hypothetical protein C2S52_004658 [Perilla frutescens var. hirtella]